MRFIQITNQCPSEKIYGMGTNYGHIELQIEQLLKEKGISKNQLCKELDIPRTNLNRYCRNDFQRIDCNLVCKICSYLNIRIEELMVYVPARDI